MSKYPSNVNQGDVMPEKHPKMLDKYHTFRIIMPDDFKTEFGKELPVIPILRDIKSKSLKIYANEKTTIKVGELVEFIRYESRLDEYIFWTDERIEISISETFINRNFLFPINLARLL